LASKNTVVVNGCCLTRKVEIFDAEGKIYG